MTDYENIHVANIKRYEKQIADIYRKYAEEITRIGANITGAKAPFSFDNYPETKKLVDKLLKNLAKETNATVISAIKKEVALANENVNSIAQNIYDKGNGSEVLTVAQTAEWFKKYTSTSLAAADKFAGRRIRGLNLSDRVWKISQQLRTDTEIVIEQGITEGRSAAQMARDVKAALNDPNRLFRRVMQPDGTMQLSNAAKKYHPGQGVYRSSYKNALRLTGTETNIAYRSSFHDRIQSQDWITGIEVRLSNNHTCKDGKGGLIKGWKDICDELKGIYPKDFLFTGWHPNCFSDDMEILTRTGWKLFKDVSIGEEIFSLNPVTRCPEWVEAVFVFCRDYSGDMVRFSSRNLDCLVTPEHEMIYLGKTNGGIKKCSAREYTKGKGAFYRGCNWTENEISTIIIGKEQLDFPLFCEFMGYWLSDGSLIREYQIKIAQRDGDPNKEKIQKCLRNLGFKVGGTKESVDVYSKDLNSYLRKFGKSFGKFIPDEIKNASKEEIQIFLDAFISCDGYIKKAKPFMGSRGKMCNPRWDERIYFTTSPKMASDLGELILKIGKRPSYYTNKVAGEKHQFKNGVYTINHDCFRVAECNATTATVFDKEVVPYSGMVYDLTLERNHIMYVRRNGKCFWGSNCRCEQIIVRQDPIQAIREFKQRISTAKQITELPQSFKDWQAANADRIEGWKERGTIPYFLRDNEKMLNI